MNVSELIKRKYPDRDVMDLSTTKSKRQRTILSVEEKVQVILEIEKGKQKAEICREYGLKSSTLSTIWTNKDKYLHALEHLGKSGSKFKRLRRPDKYDIDEALLKWFKQQRNKNVQITGPILTKKAETFAKLLGHDDFVCNNGWIDRFKLRHDISFPKSKEVKLYDKQQIINWIESVWKKFRDGYEDNDIFNADEFGLFFKAKPEDVSNLCNEKCVNGQFSKDRITVCVCANGTGTEKRKLVIISDQKCFNNISNSCNYYPDSKSWITQEIFLSELRNWNNDLKVQNRKILLLLDNDITHTSFPVLLFSNIKLVFLPSNNSGKVQPIYSIVRWFKFHYRKQILNRLIEMQQDYKLTLQDAIEILEKSWNIVSREQICNAFRKTGFYNTGSDVIVEDIEDLPKLSSQILSTTVNPNLIPYDIDKFVSFDDYLTTSQNQTDQEIVQEVMSKNDIHLDEEEDKLFVVPTLVEAREAARIVSKFYDAHEVNPMIILQATNIENDLEKRLVEKFGEKDENCE